MLFNSCNIREKHDAHGKSIIDNCNYAKRKPQGAHFAEYGQNK
jgi:hypothetical protein